MTTTSVNSVSRAWSLLSKYSETSAAPWGRRVWVPVKMMSSDFCPRNWRIFCSPMTQRTASEILLLPLPLGPTIAVMPLSKVKVVLSAKDLKPRSSIFNNCIVSTLSVDYLDGHGMAPYAVLIIYSYILSYHNYRPAATTFSLAGGRQSFCKISGKTLTSSVLMDYIRIWV